MNNKKHTFFFIGIVTLLMIVIVVANNTKQVNDPGLRSSSFEECVAAGNPVIESFPRQCRDKAGVAYVEEIIVPSSEDNFEEYKPGSNYETIDTLEFSISPQKRECGSFSRQPCLVVNGENFYDPIDGFDFEAGYEYRITVEQYLRFGTDNPNEIPQDVGMYAYRLVDIKSKKLAGDQIEIKPIKVEKKCIVAGCSGQLCVSLDNADIVSTCEFLPQYACYRNASCEVQDTGECGWTQTEELQQCIQDPTNFEI